MWRDVACSQHSQIQFMRTNHRFFRAEAVDGTNSANHIVVTYNFRLHDKNTIFEFYRVVFSEALQSGINSIPPGRELTFEEELRATNFASHIEQLHGDERADEIEEKLKEVYGGATITVEEISPK
jgi:hypothetical protein